MKMKSNIRRTHSVLISVCMIFLATLLPGTELNKGKVVEEVFPGLASGVLTRAALADLPENILFKSGNLEITKTDIQSEINKGPAQVKEELKKNSFFILEQIATQKILQKIAEERDQEKSAASQKRGSQEMIRRYFDEVTSGTRVSQEEVDTFYNENKASFCGVSKDKVEEYIRKQKLQQKKQTVFEEHLKSLGRKFPIEVSATWTLEQLEISRDNPVDKIRWNSKPTLVDFGGKSCCGPDKMLPIIQSIGKLFKGKMDAVYIEASEHQVLAARYGVTSIPAQIIFNKEGKEVYSHQGALSEGDLKKKLSDLGIF